MSHTEVLHRLPKPLILSYNYSGVGDIDIADPTKPLEVLIGPIDMNPKDRIDLFWGVNKELVDSYTHSSETPNFNGIFSLYIDTRWIESGTVNTNYTYTPFPSNTSEMSDAASVIVKLSIPGGRDPDPSSPYQNEALLKPTVFPAEIITFPEGVTVTIAPYLNMEIGDRIILSWNGEFIRYSIESQDQVNKPVIISVPKEIIELAGDSDRLEVRYEIRDEVNNWSRWSLPAYTQVEAGNSNLPAPLTPQAPNMVLDLNILGGSSLQALVLAYPEIADGDVVTLMVERNTAEGILLEPFVTAKTVELPSSLLEFFVPFEQFLPLTQGRARLKYIVKKATGLTLRSKTLLVMVIGQAMQLQAPTVSPSENGLLDPSAHNVLALIPPYYFMDEGNEVTLTWMGKTEQGSSVFHEALKILTQNDIGKTLQYSIPDEKVSVLAGGTVQIHYTVNTLTRAFFKSPVLNLRVSEGSTIQLPAPTLDTVGPDNVLIPALIPDSGATVRVRYPGMSAGDSVVVQWKGASTYDTPALEVGSSAELQLNVPKSFITHSIGGSANVIYTVTRAGTVRVSVPLPLSVKQGLNLDTSPVTLSGKIYLIPGSPDLLPAFPADTTVQRTATGGQAPYLYSSSNNQIARVDENGLTSVRGNGTATVSVTDAQGATASYDVSVTGVIHCLGMGSGNFAQMNTAAGKHGARIPNSDELNQIFNAYGNRWPMGNSYYWSSTIAAQNLVGMKWYVVKNLVTGANDKLKYHGASLGVAIR